RAGPPPSSPPLTPGRSAGDAPYHSEGFCNNYQLNCGSYTLNYDNVLIKAGTQIDLSAGVNFAFDGVGAEGNELTASPFVPVQPLHWTSGVTNQCSNFTY